MNPRPPESTPFPYPTPFRSLPFYELDIQIKPRPQNVLAHESASARLRGRLPEDGDLLDVLVIHIEEGGRGDARSRIHGRSEEHTSELQSRSDLVCRLLLANK